MYGVFVLGGLGFFREAGGDRDLGHFSGVACGIAELECFSHVHMGSWSLMNVLPSPWCGVCLCCFGDSWMGGGGPLLVRLVLCKSV